MLFLSLFLIFVASTLVIATTPVSNVLYTTHDNTTPSNTTHAHTTHTNTTCGALEFVKCESTLILCAFECLQAGPVACKSCFTHLTVPCMQCIFHPPHRALSKSAVASGWTSACTRTQEAKCLFDGINCATTCYETGVLECYPCAIELWKSCGCCFSKQWSHNCTSQNFISADIN